MNNSSSEYKKFLTTITGDESYKPDNIVLAEKLYNIQETIKKTTNDFKISDCKFEKRNTKSILFFTITNNSIINEIIQFYNVEIINTNQNQLFCKL